MRPSVYRKFRLGGEQWQALWVSPRSRHLRIDGEWKVGACDYATCTIYLSRDLQPNPSATVASFLHEALHALHYVSGAEKAYGRSRKIEEDIILPLTPLLHQFLEQTVDLFIPRPA